MKNRRLISLLMIIPVIGLIVQPVSAGWMDDWLAQKTETQAGYFEGQKRGYYTAGSFSARWPQGRDYLMTVTPPKLKAGCGGIDMFMGGFSFLNFDYLVQKLQRIMQAAPAAAFDIALKVLCPDCSNTIKDMENIINKLNNLQLDDCKAAKALVATIAPPGFDDKSGTLAKAQGEFRQSSGVDDLWTSVKKAFTSNKGNPPDNAAGDPTKGVTSGCPDDIKNIFGEGGSIIEKLSSQFGESPYADMVRGYIGDVVVTKMPNGNIKLNFIARCEQNENMNINNFVNGNTYSKNTAGQCTKNTDSALTTWVILKIDAVASKYRSGAKTTDAENAFLDSNPLPLSLIIKHAIGTKQESAVLGTVSEITAKAYAYQAQVEFYNKITVMLEKAKQVWTAQKDAKDGADTYTCQIEMFNEAPGMITQMEERLYQTALGLRASYAALANEMNNVMQVVDKMRSFDEMAKQLLTSKFGKAVATRAVEK